MKNIFLIVALTFVSAFSFANERDWGRVSASLESNNHIYVEDKANNFIPSDLLQLSDGEIFANNDYLKIDYYKSRLSAGMQLEGYFPSLVGYPFPINKLSISNLYVSWKDDNYSVTAGTFYDQLGSGLLFRAWEDRTLGLNNALLGARATYSFDDKVSLKAFWGIPRLDKWSEVSLMRGNESAFFGHGLATDANIAAADVNVSISEIIGWDNLSLSLEGSLVNKHESYKSMNPAIKSKGFPENNLSWSARANVEVEGFYTKFEYVDALTAYKEHVVRDPKELDIKFGDGILQIKNVSDDALEDVIIYYKVVHQDGKYFGGRTYMVRVESLEPGQTVQTDAGHFTKDSTQIVRVDMTKATDNSE